MNTQKKQYTVQFFSPPDDWWCSQSLSAITELADFMELTKLMEESSCPRLCTEHDIYGSEYFHCPAWAGCAPSQLLYTCSLAKHGKLKKVLGFLATTKNINILSTLFSYYTQNSA